MKRVRTTFRALALLLTVALLCASSCRAAVVYVNKSATGPVHDGASWATAYTTTLAGLKAAKAGDEVWVASGTYTIDSFFELPLSLPSGVGLYGGFNGTELSRNQRNPAANVTILEGLKMCSVVSIAADATSDTILDGFTIQNGAAQDMTGNGGTGGGIYVTGGTPIISNNVIRNCSAWGSRTIPSYGGGIYVNSGAPLIAGNTITGNGAIYGGGIIANGGLIRDNLISYNAAGPGYYNNGDGGGIYITSSAVAVHNVLVGNDAQGAYGGGGGIAAYYACVFDNTFVDNTGFWGTAIEGMGNSTIIRNTITDFQNHSQGLSEVNFAGGVFANNLIATKNANTGMYVGKMAGNTEGQEPMIMNNTISGQGTNWMAQYGIESVYSFGETPLLSGNIIVGWQTAVYHNSGFDQPVFTVDHNDIYGNGNDTLALPGASPIGQNGNISQDPLFVNPAALTYRLQAGSPCIDAGNDTYVASGDRDLAGAPRIYGAHVDIGAYEYGSPLYTLADAAEVLRIAAGISIATPADRSRLDVVPEPSGETHITVADATLIAKWLLN